MNKSLYSHIIDNLYKIKTSTNKISPVKINAKQNEDLKEKILYATSFLPVDRVYSERIYCISNDIYEAPTCIETGELLKWSPCTHSYSRSRTSGFKHRRYNSSNIKKRYKDIEVKFKENFEAGSFIIMSSCEIKNKIKQYKTNIKHWDIEKDYDFFCSVKKLTSFLPTESMWGERFFCISNDIMERVVSVDGGYANYINKNTGYSTYSSRSNLHTAHINHIKDYVSKHFFILDDITNIIQQKKISIQCKVCNHIKKQLFTCGYWQDICCNNCTGYGINRSKAEDEIIQFINQYDIHAESNTRQFGDFEIDILIPCKKIAIEYNGVLWHSFGTKFPNNSMFEKQNKQKDINKKLKLLEHNINLITIFDTEWLFKQDIVKSIILSKMGIYQHKHVGRKCSLREITKQEKSDFYKQNHIQGNCQSFYDVGLIYNNEIVSAMSFSRRKISKHNKVELVRFCNKLNTVVVGGFSKLFKNALLYLNCDIISYCDLRFSNGDVYIKNNFQQIRRSIPNYFYTKDCIKLEGRLNFQKHKLTKFKSYDKAKTETAILYEEGYRKVYDCGNLVFEYTNIKS